jgi:enoyl-CoA hydratase
MSSVRLEVRDRVAFLTIDRPEALNALNASTIQALHEQVVALDANDEVRVVVVTGAGPKSFVAGADIAEFAGYSPEEGKALAQRGHELLFNRIVQARKPYIAAVNGFALGGGLELAMACHVRLASSSARMGLPEASLGVIPGYGGTQRLVQLVGKGRALEMMFSASMIDAAKAETWGLVNAVHEPDQLLEAAEAMARQFIKASGDAQTAIIRTVNAATEGGPGFAAEIEEFGARFATAEFTEGTTAFLEKRKPSF